jgi:hypothetical protein
LGRFPGWQYNLRALLARMAVTHDLSGLDKRPQSLKLLRAAEQFLCHTDSHLRQATPLRHHRALTT